MSVLCDLKYKIAKNKGETWFELVHGAIYSNSAFYVSQNIEHIHLLSWAMCLGAGGTDTELSEGRLGGGLMGGL